MSKQQTLFHHFISGPRRQSPSRGNGDDMSQPAMGQKAVNQENITENLEDDLLLAAFEDWEETTLSHPADEKDSAVANSKPDRSQHNATVAVLSPQEQPIPRATQPEDLPGFDASAGEIWIYPTNLPVRDYQYNIVQQALFKNTMVSLPTGLGKTFVAAVVMYNFYRWYPEGRVVFMAPTKPLVAQQIEACHNVMGIQQSDMAEMTGNMPPAERKKAWHKCRVFFLTPQVLMNDLSRRACPTQLVKCLVVDEAHKALGNHAYCQVVRELSNYSSEFRVLALSATPGSDLKAIQQVITNLLISHIEIRSEDSIDIQRYVHERKVEKVIVPLDEELKSVRDQYLRILSVYVGRLTRCGVLYNKDPTSLTKFQILQSRDAFRQDPPPQVKSRGVVEGDFALCISLYHGFELLLQHGLRSLFSFLQSTVDGDKGFSRTRQELLRNAEFVQLMDTLRDKFGEEEAAANQSGLFSVPGTPRVREVKPYVTSHPKMAKLQEIVLEHFRRFSANKESPSSNGPSTSKHQPQPAAQSTRVMIFAQYRDSVNEIAEMLNRHRPLLRCMGFVGQASTGKTSKGISQKEQLRVVKEFREGGYNTLVCTCVGEEGLDIGDVDLIVCYDAHKSPIRLVQRMGRTGRKRQGRIVMLVTEGKEAAVYDRSQYSKKGIVKALQGNARSLQLYPNNPRMVPRGLNPKPHQMFISVKAFTSKDTKRRSSTGANNETRLDSFIAKAKSRQKSSEYLSPEELAYWSANYKLDSVEKESLPCMPDRGRFITLEDKDKQPSQRKGSHPKMSLSEWAPWQISKQPVRLVEHSHRCQQFVELMEFIDLQNLTEGEDIYGLEMQTYLDPDDIRPRKKGIESYCTKQRKDSSEGDSLNKGAPGTSHTRQPQPSLSEAVDETSPEPPSRKRQSEKVRRKKQQPMQLMSSPSESNHSDDNLPDVFNRENMHQVSHEVLQCIRTPTSAEKNSTRSDSRSKKRKGTDSKAPSADKPRKHKQKRKHLNPVTDSLTGNDDDFTGNLKEERAFGDRKTKSPGMEGGPGKVVFSKDDLVNRSQPDVTYDTPEPMDTGSDDNVMLEHLQKSSVLIQVDNLPSTLPSNTDDDLSFLFPTQTVFLPPSARKDDHNTSMSESKPSGAKSAMPPPPPSLSSLDLLDDMDTTFNLTQHFQSKSAHFGGHQEPPKQPVETAPCQDSFKAEDAPDLERLQESQANELTVKMASEKVSPWAFINGNSDRVSSEQTTNATTDPPSHEKAAKMKVKDGHNDSHEESVSMTLRDIEPQFDLNLDFTVVSSDEEADTLDEKERNKDDTSGWKSGEPTNGDQGDGQRIGDGKNIWNDEMGSVIGTPKAFDVQTPSVESVITETSFRDTNKASVTPVAHSPQAAFNSTKERSPRKLSLQRRLKKPSTVTPETPKSGLDKGTKSVFAGRLDRDGISRQSHAGFKSESRRELDLEVQDEPEIRPSALQAGGSMVQQTQAQAEIEKLRMEVLGSTKPKFDLEFDLDNLEEDSLGEEDDIVAPSPNMEQQQEYINLSQVTSLKGEVCPSHSKGTASFQATISSTPVSKAKLQLRSVPCADLLSPIAIDKGETEKYSGFEDHPPTLTEREPKAPQNNKGTEPAKGQEQMRRSLTLKRKSPQMLQTSRGDKASSSVEQLTTNLTDGAFPGPVGGAREGNSRQSSNTRLAILGKRKSAPIVPLTSDTPITIKSGISELSASSLQNLHAEPNVRVVNRKDGQGIQGSSVRTQNAEEGVTGWDEHYGEEDPRKTKGRGRAEPFKAHFVDSDEDEDLSQLIRPRKRRKAVALQSPSSPAFKTPVRPAGESSGKKTPAKPLISSSDEDLESPLIRRPKKRRQITTKADVDGSDDDLMDENYNKKNTPVIMRKAVSKKRQPATTKEPKTKKGRFASGSTRDFLDEEAEVSDTEECSPDEEGSDLDKSLEGFINNASQLSQASQSAFTSEDMHAVYMQSVHNLPGGGISHPAPNRFKMVQHPTRNDIEIFSQVPVQDDSYYENSFVVREGEEEGDDVKITKGGGRQGKRDQFEESLFENTINPDNILSSKCRRRNKGPSRAQQILKEGRKKLLMSSSSTSTSAEEIEEGPRGPNRRMHPSDKRKCLGKRSLSASHQAENPSSTGWLCTDKTSKGGSHPCHSQGSVIRQFLVGNARQANSCPDVVLKPKQGYLPRRPTDSDGKTASIASNGLTLAEKERVERLKRQEEKKKEFMRKMEEKKRELLLQDRAQQQQRHQTLLPQQQQNQSKPAGEQLNQQRQCQLKRQQQAQQLRVPQHQPQQQLQRQQTGGKPQQQRSPKQQQQKAELYCGRSSSSAGLNVGKVRVKRINQQGTSPSSCPKSSSSTVSSLGRTASAVSNLTHEPGGDFSLGNQAGARKDIRNIPVPPSSMRGISKSTLAGSQDAMSCGKPVILIDSKELSSSAQIVSILTLKHNLNPHICLLSGCDYIVSARMGVEKKSMSDFGNGANKNKLIDRVRHLCDLFDRPCLILEKDRVKPADDKKPRQLIRTKYFDSTLAALSKTHIKLLYSDSLEDTARILADLVHIEMRKGEGLAPLTSMNTTQEQVFKLYQSLPRVSYATALSLMKAFPCIQELIHSSPEQVRQKTNISLQKSAEICCFLQHRFDEQMMSICTGK
ncbi:Fanconi anemia group M protein-like isoform X2 [Acanthaster planci]|uniref:Fanconi anemia group M protein-like isoform X2 n=1 Tax=Acanthaster planci TaxID=133434 RepID=A0A8B7YBF5_ACAPL|nr:Fanconi anemia group M protein-like isoform X2 [Acanthaster planci]